MPTATLELEAAYLVVGAGAGGWNVLSATRRQRLTPGAMMGRVTSAYRMLEPNANTNRNVGVGIRSADT